MLNSILGFFLLVGSALGINPAPAPAIATGGGSGTIMQLSPWITTASTTKMASTTAKLRIPSLASCDTIDTDSAGYFACGTDTGGSSSFPFTTQSTWVSTSTLVNFVGGVMSTASSTIQLLHFGAADGLTLDTGFGANELYDMDQHVLTTSDVVFRGLTATQATTTNLYASGSSTFQTINLGAITIPSLTLGGLGVNSAGLVYKYATTTFSGGLTYLNGNVTNTITAGDGLTRNTDDIDCDVASASIPGCLSAADWTIFNDKAGFTYPWTTQSTWMATTSLLSISGGVMSVASSTFQILNSAAISAGTISGTSLTINDIVIDTNGVVLDTDGDGALSLASNSGGSQEEIRVNLDDTANEATWTSSTGVTVWNMGTMGLYSLASSTWQTLQSTLATLTNVVVSGSIQVPNDTAPVVDAIGEIAFDTTDAQILFGTSTNASYPDVQPTVRKLWGATIASTSPDLISGGRIWLPPQRDGFTVKEIHCAVDAGTSVVVNLSNSGGTTDSETITCDADGAIDTAVLTNNLYAAGSLNSLEIGTLVGSVDYLTIAIYGSYTRE